MNRIFASLSLVCASFLLAPRPASAVLIAISTVPVGNVGNANDPSDGDAGRAGIQHFGAVPYAYRIGTYEVTNAQYAEFLNAKGNSDPLNLYNANMGSDVRGGITQSGVSGSFTYAVKANMGNKPVCWVSWHDSIRFANWLHNGQGTGDTETGAYTLGALGAGGIPTSSSSITRNPGATWFLPSENEWYKASYYQPSAQGGDADNYWLFSTRSNNQPTTATANSVGDISNPGTNVINYLSDAAWNNRNGNVTTVGSAGPLSQSFYGTSDQAGNADEWNQTLVGGSSRVVRGGAYYSSTVTLLASSPIATGPTNEVDGLGFRVATVPEPSTLSLAFAGLTGAVLYSLRARRKK